MAEERDRTGDPAETASRDPSETETPLRRAIGTRLLFLFVLGDMLGGGIYTLVGKVGAETGGAIWVAFLAAFVLAGLTAFAYAELVTKYPQAAGTALYADRAFGIPFLTFMVGFAVMASGVTSAGTLARGFGGDYLSAFVDLPIALVALVFIVLIALINLRGILESVAANAAFTLIEVAGLLLIVVIGALALGAGEAEPARVLEFKSGTSPVVAVLAGTGLAFYALIGFEDSVNVAEETRDPRRAFPRALFGGLVVAGLIYVLVALTASMVVDTARLAGSDGPLLEVVRVGAPSVPPTLFAGIALFAVANSALINMVMASRLVYGMADRGLVPRVFGRLLPGRRTPWAAIAFTTLLAGILIVTGDLEDLADTTVMLLLVVFVVVNVSVLVLRRDRVEHDHFRAPAVFPVLGAIAAAALIVQNDGAVFLRAGIILLVGVALWAINRLVGGRSGGELDADRLEDSPSG